MGYTFTPSLCIGLGPSAVKALNRSKELLGHLQDPFKNVIEFYNLIDLSRTRSELQKIIDNKLLSAVQLNKLLDLGFKVRTSEKTPVKLNLYFLWDISNSTISGYDVVKLLTTLKFGSMAADVHTGASITILAILDREWELNEK